MSMRRVFLLVILCYLSYYGKADQVDHMKLSREEELEIENQLKLLNKPSLKTIKTHRGDVYHCVDFYKQPAFNHPLLKNHSYNFQMRSFSHRKMKMNVKGHSNTSKKLSLETGFKGECCPIGTVPIRRTTKENLIKAKLFTKTYASRINPLTTEKPGLHHAVVRTKFDPNKKYNGCGTIMSFYSLKVTGSQYSSSQMTIRNGLDSIQVGWTVNPSLYGDNKTRLFTFFQAGALSCFNTQCPGFVIVNTHQPLDEILEPVSQRGGPIFEFRFFIYRDQVSRNWWLEVGKDYTQVGYWPASMFSGLKDFATYVEWGGEAYSPPSQPSPPMGSGFFLDGDSYYDAYCRVLTTINEAHEPDDAENTEVFVDDTSLYKVRDYGNINPDFRHLMMYGGPGQS